MKKYKLLALFFILCPLSLMAHGVSASDQAMLDSGGLLSYIFVGAKHMVTGYDHLLFLVGVIFFLRNFKDILKFVTIFTIAHCITLVSATYLGITANEHLVDAVIALSVLYKGFENLDGFQKIFKTNSPNLLFMVFIFGLIHGFGLATRLQSFDMGVDYFLAKILCFNIGVEIGQIAALIPIIFIINYWKKLENYTIFHKTTNWGLAFAGIGLFFMQMHGYLSH